MCVLATYPQEQQHGTNRGLVNYQGAGFVETLVLVSVVGEKACNPARSDGLVVLNRLHRVVLEDEDNGEEDNVDDDDKHDGDSAPLQLDDAPDTAVSLTRCHGSDALCVRWQTGPFRRGGIVGKRSEIYLDAVTKGRKLKNDRQARKDQQGNPQIRQTVLMVDMAGRAKPKGDSAGDEGDNDTDGWDAPADCL